MAYGGGLHDGNAHNHEGRGWGLAGGGCGALSTGRHIRLKKETPLSNLWVSMLNRMEATVEKLGDSSGALPELFDPSAKPIQLATPTAATIEPSIASSNPARGDGGRALSMRPADASMKQMAAVGAIRPGLEVMTVTYAGPRIWSMLKSR